MPKASQQQSDNQMANAKHMKRLRVGLNPHNHAPHTIGVVNVQRKQLKYLAIDRV
jgi:hypothetical protein